MPRFSKKNDNVLKEVMRLMNEAGIPLDRPRYAFEEWCDHIQAWINREYGVNSYQLVLFKKNNSFIRHNQRTSTTVNDPIRCKQVYICHDDVEDSYMPIRHIGPFMRRMYYW